MDNADLSKRDKLIAAGVRTISVKVANAAGRLIGAKALHKIMTVTTAATVAVTVVTITASANADGILGGIDGVLATWIPKLGGMVAAVGGLQLAIGFKDDNPDAKVRGMQTMIGGAIIIGVAGFIKFAGS